jgi:ATP-dependent DNA helicase RecQ (EC 3.6.1.-)
LSDNSITALPYHAGMDAGARKHNQDRFMTEPGLVMVATIAFWQWGSTNPDVRYVFHVNLPGEQWKPIIKKSAVPGRDGEPAEAMMPLRSG